jgi:hypothetical protein
LVLSLFWFIFLFRPGFFPAWSHTIASLLAACQLADVTIERQQTVDLTGFYYERWEFGEGRRRNANTVFTDIAFPGNASELKERCSAVC